MKINALHFQSRRLDYRPLVLGDIESLHAIWTSEAVRKYLWDDELIPIEQTREMITKNKNLFKKESLGLWAVRELNKKPLIGFGGFWYFNEPPELQILFGLQREYWGQGLATEVARSMIQYGFEAKKLVQIRGCNDNHNVASARVMQKAGMLFEKQTLIHNIDSIYYRIIKSQWHPDGSLEFHYVG